MLIFQANKNIQSLTRNLDNYVKKQLFTPNQFYQLDFSQE